LFPVTRPVIFVLGLFGVAIVTAGPPVCVQTPTSPANNGVTPVSIVDVLPSQKAQDPAPPAFALVTDCVGAGTIIATSSVPFTQGPETEYLNT
jgi:hypothetical protein